jgi:hypothetical protein
MASAFAHFPFGFQRILFPLSGRRKTRPGLDRKSLPAIVAEKAPR